MQHAPQFADRHGTPLQLELFKFDACPFCRRVMRRIEQLGISMTYHDTLRDPDARRRLIDLGGKSQVPCLIINGKPLYESWDIIEFLENQLVPISG